MIAIPRPLTHDDDGESLVHATAATRNACRLCTPLGACLAFKGVDGAVPFLHGSQGCSTYIRRYLISHFREPVDIAASNFSEDSAVFGGGANLRAGLNNVHRQYSPEMIGVATTCLSETIGEDMPALISECREDNPDLPPMVHVSTPSFRGSHVEGYHAAVKAMVCQLAVASESHGGINVLPGMLSPADLRHLRELVEAFGLSPAILPDYSETLDGGSWSQYERLPGGGIPVETIRRMGGALITLELGASLAARADTAAAWLENNHHVPRVALSTPIGIRATDRFVKTLESVTRRELPPALAAERGRLVDAMVDGHKIVFGKRAVVFGDPDMVIGYTALLSEIGVTPVLVASGSRCPGLREALRAEAPQLPADIRILDGIDFAEMDHEAADLAPDLLVGHGKGYKLARKLDVPLLRVGFPIHDRIGAQRVLHIGYRGMLAFFDQLANTLLECKQDLSEPGFTYL
jgi:nitrogenase molybdenum-iron protein NifN